MLTTRLRGARTHNLDGVDLDLVPGQLVVLTGVSGAGKSSLALDTLYAEGQRRFVESFSPYARQFLERLARPPMDSLEPVPAGVAVDRGAPIKSSRSTVATMADLEPYLAALFVREAVPLCPEHRVAGVRLDPSRAAVAALTHHEGERLALTYRVWVDDPEQYLELRDGWAKDGFRRLWIDGEARDIDDIKPSQVSRAGRAYVVVDRVVAKSASASRLAAGIEQAWSRASDVAHVHRATRVDDDTKTEDEP